MSSKETYNKEFLPYVIKWGSMTNLIAYPLQFLPGIALAVLYGLFPPVTAIIAGAVAQISVSGAFWIVEPISYFPILGVPGTYMAFLSGNIANLRLPCASVAQKAAGVEPGTEEGSIAATLGVAASVMVNTAMLTMGIFIGAAIFYALPTIVRVSLQTYLLPAIFGAVFTQFAIRGPKYGMVALTLALPLCYLGARGILPAYVVILSCVFGTIFIGRYIIYERERRKVKS
ncbi:MAG: hypothetical protein QXX81_05160 [Zestosphaera sp.]